VIRLSKGRGRRSERPSIPTLAATSPTNHRGEEALKRKVDLLRKTSFSSINGISGKRRKSRIQDYQKNFSIDATTHSSPIEAFQDDVVAQLPSIGHKPKEEVFMDSGYRVDAIVGVNGKTVGIEGRRPISLHQ